MKSGVSNPVRPDSAEQDLSVAVSAGAENITSRVCAFTEQAKLDMTRLRGIGIVLSLSQLQHLPQRLLKLSTPQYQHREWNRHFFVCIS